MAAGGELVPAPPGSTGICQATARRDRHSGIDVTPHPFRHHFSHTWLDNGGAEGDLMELNGWASPIHAVIQARTSRKPWQPSLEVTTAAGPTASARRRV
jgi:integrase